MRIAYINTHPHTQARTDSLVLESKHIRPKPSNAWQGRGGRGPGSPGGGLARRHEAPASRRLQRRGELGSGRRRLRRGSPGESTMRADSGARLQEGHLVSGEGRVGLQRWRVNSYTWRGGGGCVWGALTSWGSLRESLAHGVRASAPPAFTRVGRRPRRGRDRTPGVRERGLA